MPAQHIHILQSLYMTLLVCRWRFHESFPWLANILNLLCFLSTGPDAVKYIVNHADVQAIFCVPTTLNTVSEIPPLNRVYSFICFQITSV